MTKKKVEGNGDCYAVAGRMVMLEDSATAQWMRLCHGTAIGQGPLLGRPVPHAWVEVAEGVVIDKSNGLDITMRRERYYEIGQIKPEEVKRYTQKEALELVMKTNHYGPWHEDVQE